MKKTITLVSTILALTFHANASERLCYDIDLSFNTHPHRECPGLEHFCLQEEDMLLTLKGGQVLNLKFEGRRIVSQSDVGQEIFNSYSSKDLSLNLYYNNDGNYPASITEGFRSISLSTGLIEPSGVYYSQSCSYDLF